MDEKIIFEKDSVSVKNPLHLQRNVFVMYSLSAVKIEPATHRKIDTDRSDCFFTPKLKRLPSIEI